MKYMICKDILLITFLNEPELIFFHSQMVLNIFNKIGLVWFYDISTIVGYLISNLFYTYKQFYFKQLSLA